MTTVIIRPDAPYKIEVRTRGVQGIRGLPGDAATIEVGDVTTLPPGAPATVVNSGTSENAVFDFGLPQGGKGDPGNDGLVTSIVAGAGISVNSADPANPVVSATGGGGGGQVDSIVPGIGIDIDDTDPINPVVGLDAASVASLELADTAVQPGALATVATTGEYSDLSGLPTLGDAAALDVGTTAGTVAAGDDSRITGALQPSDIASSSEIRSAAADKLLPSDTIWDAAEGVNLGNLTGTVELDWSDFLGSAYGVATGNITLGEPDNAKPGQTLVLEITQDGTGSRTLSYNTSYWLAPAGEIDWDTTANALNVLVCTVLRDGMIMITCPTAGGGLA